MEILDLSLLFITLVCSSVEMPIINIMVVLSKPANIKLARRYSSFDSLSKSQVLSLESDSLRIAT